MTDITASGSGEAATRATEEAAFYHEAALNAAWTGSRLAIGALSFLFGAFAFAYFYLFSSNGHGMWLPSSTRIPSNHYGEAITGLIVVSASWAAGPGKLEQWTLLARARALDSSSYIVAAGQADPGEPLASSAPTGVGGSLVVSPFGDVVAAAGADPQLLIADVALERVAKARETIAVLRNYSAFANPDKAESPR